MLTKEVPPVCAPVCAVALKRVSKHFGGYAAVKDISLAIAPGQFVSVVGPSGCGKSTLLNLVAGLTAPSEGWIEISGAPLAGLNGRAVYMFQQDALLPWKTVLENVKLGLAFRRCRGPDVDREAQHWIDRVGLRGFARHYPRQLSGGMRKRAALAQCWIMQPDIVLMDEPFAALDVHGRLRMQGEVAKLATDRPTTVMLVTHDLEEAISLSDEVVLLSAGPGSRVIGRFPIELERPRELLDLRTDPRFRALYDEIWRQLRREVATSYEQRL